MSGAAQRKDDPLFDLNRAFLVQHPAEAARVLESLSEIEAASLLQEQPEFVITAALEKVTPGIAEGILKNLSAEKVAGVLELLSLASSISIFSRLKEEERENLLSMSSDAVRKELLSLLSYPADSAGRLMNPRVAVFNINTRVEDAVAQLQQDKLYRSRKLYLVNADLQLQSQVDAHSLLYADPGQSLSELARPVTHYVSDIDPHTEVIKILEASKTDAIPVVNVDFHVVGIIEGMGIIEVVREEMAQNLQTMVGASREERALSSSFFAVRKRLPWLQINLVTAFMAALVVSLFEDTIARFTALAVLMPIAAGQSGNTGAQALAVTMRGLTLREVSMRDWFRILRKEFGAGLMNGIGVALVCGLGVYLWSNFGLALVMASAMVISMVIAGVSGALVPMVLKRFGMDPAQSSSIVLTTITDITGFMSFLGIATLLAGMLEAGS